MACSENKTRPMVETTHRDILERRRGEGGGGLGPGGGGGLKGCRGVDHPPCQQRSQCKVNSKRYIVGKTVSKTRQYQFMTAHFQRHTIQCEQLTHTLNMTLRNTHSTLEPKAPKKKFLR